MEKDIEISGWMGSIETRAAVGSAFKLGPSINGLVTDGNTKVCCRDFISALFQKIVY